MIYAVYVPLLVPLIVAPFARPVATRIRPSVAVPTLALLTVVLAVCSTISLVLLAATHWPDFGLGSSERLPAGANPTHVSVATAAAFVAVLVAVAAVVTARRRVSALRRARWRYHGPTTVADGVPVMVLRSPRPEAFSLPAGRMSGGMVVVSTGMLAGLDDDERAVLLAHERSHVIRNHHRLIAMAQVSAAAHPGLLLLSGAVRFATERWADEDAATASRDRRLSARAVGKAALLAREYDRDAREVRPPGSLGVEGTSAGDVTTPRNTGAVPRRVAALLASPPPAGRWILPVCALVVAMSGTAAGEAIRDLGALFAFWSVS